MIFRGKRKREKRLKKSNITEFLNCVIVIRKLIASKVEILYANSCTNLLNQYITSKKL